MPHRPHIELIATLAAGTDRPWCWQPWRVRTGTHIPPWHPDATADMFDQMSSSTILAIRTFMEHYKMASPALRKTHLKATSGVVAEGREALQTWLEQVWEPSWGMRSLCEEYCKEGGLTIYKLAKRDSVCGIPICSLIMHI